MIKNKTALIISSTPPTTSDNAMSRPSLKRRMIALPDFPFKTEVARLVRRGNPEAAEADALAERIYGHYLRGKPVHLALPLFLAIAFKVDEVKTHTIGTKAGTRTENALMQLVAEHYALETPVSLADVKFVEDEAKKLRTDASSWLYPKATILGALLMSKFNTVELARNIRFRGPAWLTRSIDELIGKVADDLRETSFSMMQELSNLRRYGVKTSFFQDGMFHQQSDAWFFTDFTGLGSQTFNMSASRMTTRPLAFVSLASRASITGIIPRVVKYDFGKAKMNSIDFGFDPHLIWTIDDRGELFNSPSSGVLSVRKLFAGEGREEFYEIMRFSQVLRLYDLVVPIEVVQTMPTLPRLTGGLVRRIVTGFIKGREMPFTPAIVVPRLRALENPQHLVEELEREVEQADEETIRRSREAIRRHEVVAHVRRLPEGHHPSAEARRVAREELGIELADNETYVRKHERGTGEPVNGPHRAKHRRIDA